MVSAGGAAVLLAAGTQKESGITANFGNGAVNAVLTHGSGAGLNGGQYGLYAGTGVNLGYIKGAPSNVGGRFANCILAIPATNFSVTLMFNANMQMQGISIGPGPGIGFARTETTTDLLPIVQPWQC